MKNIMSKQTKDIDKEELKRLRKFEKEFRKIQAKLVKYDELRWNNMRYENLYQNAIEELEYL